MGCFLIFEEYQTVREHEDVFSSRETPWIAQTIEFDGPEPISREKTGNFEARSN